LIETGRFFVVLVEEVVKPHRQEGGPCLAQIGCALSFVYFQNAGRRVGFTLEQENPNIKVASIS
jgi:hypothetical protein